MLPQHILSDDLYRRVVHFTEQYCVRNERLYRYGWGHLLFACYAAFPAHLSPDLLHKLRLNFRQYRLGDEQALIHPVAVSDLLLSTLVRESGFERYEMQEDIRAYLLWLLRHSGFWEAKGVEPLLRQEASDQAHPAAARLDQIAHFLLRYAAESYAAPDPVSRGLREAQEWTAYAWLQPDYAAALLRQRLAQSAKPAETFHYSRMTERLGVRYELQLNSEATAAPGHFQTLRAYTQGITAFYTGKSLDAEDAFLQLSDFIGPADPAGGQTSGIRLKVPEQTAKALLQKRPDLAGRKPAGPRPRVWDSLQQRMQSRGPKAALLIGDGDADALTTSLVALETALRERYNDLQLSLSAYFDIIAGIGGGVLPATLLAAGESVEGLDNTTDIFGGNIAQTETAMRILSEFGVNQNIDELSGGLALFMESDKGVLHVEENITPTAKARRRAGDTAQFVADALKSPQAEAYGMENAFQSNAGNIGGPGIPTYRSAAGNSEHLFELALAELLIECQTAYLWPTSPEQILLVVLNVAAGSPQDERSYMQMETPAAPSRRPGNADWRQEQDNRWLNRHTLDLLQRHRLSHIRWTNDGQTGAFWPDALALEPAPSRPASSKAPERKARKK